MSDKEVSTVISLLEEIYPFANCELNHRSPFQLLIAVVLSAQTTDIRVNEVTEELFRQYPDLDAMLELDEERLSVIIRKIGMYRTKSKNVMALCRKLKNDFGGNIPETFAELVTLPGVGRKTANVVLSNAFGQQAIAVDTHVFRVSNRIGIVSGSDPLKTELALMQRLPKEKWTAMHHMLIWHGRRQCFARNPQCASCGINDFCMMFRKAAVK